MKQYLSLSALSFLLFLLFVIFTILVSANTFSNTDYQITVFFQQILPSFVTTPFSVFSILGSAEIASLFLLVLLVLIPNLRKLYVLILYGLTGLIEILGKSIIVQIAPPVEFLKTNLHFSFPSGGISGDFFSYPSGHLARTAFISGALLFAIYTSFKNRKRSSRFALPAIALATVGILTFDFVMFVSRVYLGEHWLTDVVGGVLLGLALAFVSSFLILKQTTELRFKSRR